MRSDNSNCVTHAMGGQTGRTAPGDAVGDETGEREDACAGTMRGKHV